MPYGLIPAELMPAVVRLLPVLVMLVVGLAVLRAGRNRLLQAMVAVVLGVTVALAVGGVADMVPADAGALRTVLLAVRSVAIALCIIGVASVAPVVVGAARPGRRRRWEV